MKIDNSNLSLDSLVRGGPAVAAKPAAAPTPDSGVLVTLSPQFMRSAERADRTDSAPAFDVSRVDEIKNAIRSGGIKIDIGKIADGLLNSVGLMLAAK